MEEIATFTGHAKENHSEFYRLQRDVNQAWRVANVLLLMEKGGGEQFRRKILNKIDVDNGVYCSSESENDELVMQRVLKHIAQKKRTENQDNVTENFITDNYITESSPDEYEEPLTSRSEGITSTNNPRVACYTEEAVDVLSDRLFKEQFRLSRATFMDVLEKFERSESYQSSRKRKPAKSAKTHLLIFLRFAGNKCSIKQVSRLFSIDVSDCHILIDRVMDFLMSLSSSVIKFPNRVGELENSACKFEQITGFPGTVGWIDRASFNIKTPVRKPGIGDTNREETLVMIQGICDADKRFIDVLTGAPEKVRNDGATRLSVIKNKIMSRDPDYHILGDSSYPICETLLTPYLDDGNLKEDEKRYNKKFSQTRAIIGDAFGLLKGRFPRLEVLDFNLIDKAC